jgi:hypothetical protein
MSEGDRDHGQEVERFDPLSRLRGFRVRGDRGRGVSDDCDQLMRSLKRVSRDQSAVVEAWATGAPDDLQSLGWVSGLKGGKLEIGVENAGARHRVDRWLRGGGLEMMRELGKVRIKSVVLRIGERPGV